MIRRISANNDYRDIIRSCPSGVIDDIYEVEYYVDGYSSVYSASFSKKGSLLEVIIPSSALKTLPSGLLMRRAKYKNEDTSFPDGNYDLEFVEDMNVWLDNGSVEPGPGPVPGEYVTEEELEETLEGYVTSEFFTDEEAAIKAQINAVDDRVTALEQNPGVSQQDFAAHVAANNESFRIVQQVTEDNSQRISALENAGFATQQDLDDVGRAVNDVDTKADDIQNQVDGLDQRVTTLEQGGGGGGGTWGSITGDINDQQDLVDYVDQAIEDAISGSDIPLPENVVEYDVNHPLIEDFGLNVDVLKRNEFDHGTDVITKGLVLGYEEIKENGDITDINTIEIRNGLLQSVSYSFDGSDYHESRDPYITSSALSGYATETWVQGQGYLVNDSVDPYATCGWVQTRGYLTSGDLSGYATESWVQNQGYITSTALSGYATESWVGQQGYITSSALSGYATQSWATNQFLEENKVWTGTEAQWNQLSAAEKASYTIALITQ